MPSPGLKIYIGNLPDNLNQEDIKDYFSKYGTILNMELKGNYGFIEYEDRRMCEEAISQLHGTEFKGSQLRVEFAHGEKNGNNNFNKYKESKSCDTCFKCGHVGHWARECHNSGNAREFGGSRKPGGNRYEDRRNNETYTRDKYDRDERYPPPPPLERGGYERPYERYGRGDPPEIEYRREYRNYDRPYDRERDSRPYDRPFPEREYERYNRDNYDRPYYPPPPPPPQQRDSRDGYEREIYDRRPLPPPDVPPYPPRGRTGSPPPPPPRRSSYDRGVREVAPLSYRGRSPLPPPPRYQPEPMFGPQTVRPPPSPRGPIYRRRSSMSPLRGQGSGGSGGRAPLIYSSRPPRSPSPIIRNIHARRSGPRTPSPNH